VRYCVQHLTDPHAVPGLSGRCDAGPARMTALRIILERPHARVRVVPPSVKAGLSGQLIEVRFNNVPPPRTSPSGDRVSPESIKNSVLMAMETLAPQIWADDAFVLVFTRRSIKLGGNTANLNLFSFTVVLPFGPWIASFLEERISLWPGSYCTASSSGTFIEVALVPLDHDVFRALRLNLAWPEPSDQPCPSGGRAYTGLIVLCSLSLHHIPQCLHWEGGKALVCSLQSG
jgi:hypothetical protein